jgi:GNAT superfamily N-acetyltransferase
MTETTIRQAGPGDFEPLTDLASEYLSWAVVRLKEDYGVAWPSIEREDVRQGIAAFAEKGLMLIAHHNEQPVGMGAVHLLSDGVAEIKRMYVRQAARGLRIGSGLLDRLLEEARALDASVVRLDTVRFMHDAQRMYRSRGFIERSPYEGTEIPEQLRRHWLFFERTIGS